jgi:putative transposase
MGGYMPFRTAVFNTGGVYHIFNRGASRLPIFSNHANYIHLLGLMEDYAKKTDVGIICYCLMPNHYHFILRQEGGVSISKYINILFNSYSQAYNHQQNRTGTLFEGRFKHVQVVTDRYLYRLMAYIHRNPVTANIVEQPERWEYSDFRMWVLPEHLAPTRITHYRNEFGLPDPGEYRCLASNLPQVGIPAGGLLDEGE